MNNIGPKLLIAILIPLLGGCSAMKQKQNPKAAMNTQVISEQKKTLTPAERSRSFQLAFDEGLRNVKDEEYGVALAAFEEAVKQRPDSNEALFNLAACHEAVGDPLRAIHIYKGLIAKNPGDPDCYTNLGTSYIKMYYREQTPSWRDMAVEAWNRSLALRKDQPRVRQFLAQAKAIE
jgi:tetratricopeptide (TPR) repeat protein